MRRFEERQVTVTREVEVGAFCDGCGVSEDDLIPFPLVPVAISINEGEEGGHRTELDYCDGCLVRLAPAFVTAGSKAPYVTGVDLPDAEDDS